jgi:hypothetical protein
MRKPHSLVLLLSNADHTCLVGVFTTDDGPLRMDRPLASVSVDRNCSREFRWIDRAKTFAS